MATREDTLFEEWRKTRPNLVPDGIVHEPDFAKASPRIVFVMKEVNEPTQQVKWDLRQLLREGELGRTWNNIARWVRALQPDGAKQKWEDVGVVTPEIRRERLRTIAVMNLKKEGGGASSDWREIERYARQDGVLLQRQFDLYDPHFAVFCGVDPRLIPQFADVDPKHIGERIEYRVMGPGRYAIRVWHPQARKSAETMYYTLARAAAELRQQYG